ncbi:MAG: GDSL-type esterase/lipase family protein [Bacillota bacterium]|nr:GDSL-type esterase/lipase family protein [Bacillota bacterium]
MKIVCIGDSLTYGYGVYSGESWVDLLCQISDIEIINQGRNGDTTSGLLCRSGKDILDYKPSHVIIMAGTNDMLMGYPIHNIEDNINLLISEAQCHNINPIIAIQPPIISSMARIYWDEFINYKNVNAMLNLYREWILETTKENSLYYIDFYKLIKNHLAIQTGHDLYIDGIHPNKNGHKLMFREAYNLITKFS